MATTQKMLYRGVLGTSSATLYTVPGSTSTIITSIVVTNYTATDATVTLTLQDGSGTEGGGRSGFESVFGRPPE